MGDPRRFEVFARFLRTTFSAATTVADVAGGHGELAFWLAELGLRPTIIDPRPATFPRWVHRTLRKRAVRGGPGSRRVNIERLLAPVEEVDLRRFDLVAALHPDAPPSRQSAQRWRRGSSSRWCPAARSRWTGSGAAAARGWPTWRPWHPERG
jgi:hypothetical protein